MSAEPTSTANSVSGYRHIFGYPNFRKLWFSAFFSMLGSSVALVALPLLVYDITGSATLMSFVFSAQFLAEAIMAPVSGVLADTFDRKRLMIGATVTRAAAVVFLPFTQEAWQIAGIAIFLAAGKAIFQPADQASIPNTVPPSELVTALSCLQVMATLLRVIGPAAAAVIVGLSGPRPAFFVQAVCFVAGAAVLTGLELPKREDAESFDGIKEFLSYAKIETVEGLQTVWRTPIVRGVCATEALWSFVMASLSITFVIYAKESIESSMNSDVTYALLFGMVSTGAVLGALVARRIERTAGLPVLLAVGYFGPLFLVPMGFAPPLSIVVICAFGLGFTDAWAVIAIYTYLAKSVSDDVRGRVFAIWGGVISTSALITFAITGRLTDWLGAPAALAFVGLLIGIGGPLSLVVTGALESVRSEARNAASPQEFSIESESP